MGKKNKRSRGGKRKAKQLGSGAEPADGRADPLAMPAWDSESGSDEEAAERESFEEAWNAFARGDFRRCRALLAPLVADASTAKVRGRAQDLLARLQLDPLALGMGAIALTLLLVALIWTFA